MNSTPTLQDSPTVLPTGWESLSRADKIELAGALDEKRRRQARKTVIALAEWTIPAYKPEPIHRLIGAHLDKVIEREIQNLMIFAPPQEGKSTLVSVAFPARWFSRHPNDPLLITSYASRLAESKSRELRALMESQEYAALTDARVDPKSRAVDMWNLAGAHRGYLTAAGVRGSITGMGYGVGVIDDPTKDWLEAYSETIREAKKFWYNSVFQGRIWEGGAKVAINTPWNPDDLLMWVLRSEPEAWTVLRLPALAETQEERDENNKLVGITREGLPDPLGRKPGEAVCPGRHSREYYEDLRAKTIPAVWKALYQCAPRPSEGSIIRREWLRFYDRLPDCVWDAMVISWDCTFKDNRKSGYVVGTVWAHKDEKCYLLDLVRDRMDMPDTCEAIKNLRRKWPMCSQVLIEDKANGSAIIKALQSDVGGIVAVNPEGGKESRLRAVSNMFYRGQIYLPQRADWVEDYMTELTNFNGENSIPHDDQVDSTSQALLRWIWIQPAAKKGEIIDPGRRVDLLKAEEKRREEEDAERSGVGYEGYVG